jgi:hypothetical protein
VTTRRTSRREVELCSETAFAGIQQKRPHVTADIKHERLRFGRNGVVVGQFRSSVLSQGN